MRCVVENNFVIWAKPVYLSVLIRLPI